jgi:hypothetical protein
MNLPTKPLTYLVAIMFVVLISSADLEVDHPRIFFGMVLVVFVFAVYGLYDSYANSPYKPSKEERESLKRLSAERRKNAR